MNPIRLGLWAASLWLGMAGAAALEVAGQTFPDEVQLDGHGLLLNGAGVRTTSNADIYVAALYAVRLSSDANSIIRAHSPRRLELRVLREMPALSVYESFVDALKRNAGKAGIKGYTAQLEAFDRIFKDAHLMAKGDVIQMDFLPGQGTRVSVRGKAYPVLSGDDFAGALLSVWVGPKPVQDGLKTKLLGGG